MRKIQSSILGIMLLGVVSKAQAALPVIDTAAINQAVMQFQQMKQQYDVLKKQYDELLALKSSMTGSYGMGALLNGSENVSSRRPLPETWQEVVERQKQGFYGNRLEHYSQLFPSIETGLISQSSQDRDVVGYTLSKKRTQSAFAATEAIYNQLETRLKTVEDLVANIDQTQNIKQAMDLNSRIVAETGFISLDLARLNSMQLSLQAVLQNDQNRLLENHSEFFSKPK